MNKIIRNIIDFTEDDSISKYFVSYLYKLIKENHKQYQQYNSWKTVYVFLHGRLDSQRKIKTKDIYKRFNIELLNENDVFYFAYALEIYYSIILKFIAYNKISGGNRIDNKICEIISGKYFFDNHCLNYSSPDYYNIVNDIDGIHCGLIRLADIIQKSDIKEEPFDYIKVIHKQLFPKEMRHSMGEIYTPDWLAEYTIKKLIRNDENPHEKKYLDPTCGSGTFLFSLLRLFPNDRSRMLNQIVGIDINPLAILAAKTNYILALDYPVIEDIYLPFFNTDILKHPKYNETTLFNYSDNKITITLQQKEVLIPNSEYDLSDIADLSRALIHNDISSLSSTTKEIYNEIINLNNSERREVLDRLALLVITDFDYIIGNPPWVNWEYIPKEYKRETEEIWQYYELFDYKGINSIFVKEDISALITYVVVDNHLTNKGKLGFILKQSLFKSSKQAAGFRKFNLNKTGTSLHPYSVIDLTNITPFAGTQSMSVILLLVKDESWDYPVSYIEWLPKGKKSFDDNEKLDSILDSIEINEKYAYPIDKKDITSGWITVEKEDINFVDVFLGESEYKARIGVFTGGANAIYWLRINHEVSGDIVEVSNLTARAKNKVETIQTEIEKSLIYPLVIGSDISFWHFEYSRYLLLPHNERTKMYPISEDELKKLPLTKAYIENFKKELVLRKGFTCFDRKIHQENYYALQRIGEYTFKPYKVAWKYISKELTPCVIDQTSDKFLGIKNIVPNDKVVYVGLDDKDEAYYLCGLLSSRIIRNIISNFAISVQLSPSIIKNIQLKKYDKDIPEHSLISNICYEGHKGDNKIKLLDQIDLVIDDIYKLNN